MSSETGLLTNSQDFSAVASRRILRLSLGTGLSLLYSQLVNWPISFLAPVFTMILLATPLPALKLKQGITFAVALLLPVCAGLVLIPFLTHARWAGVILVTLALFYSFYFTAKGGSALLGTFASVGMTLIVCIGTVSVDALLAVIEGLALGVLFGLVFFWLAHALLPDISVDPSLLPAKPVAPPAPDLQEARRCALRSMVIIMPVVLILLFSNNSVAYIALMIKVASMGQQASSDSSRAIGRTMLASTAWGGLGAVLAWQWLSIWPSISIYFLLICLAALVYGSKIFQGLGMHPQTDMWNYAFLTMIIVLAPAVMDSQNGSTAGAAFYTRLLMFAVIAIYGTVAVMVFDAFWKKKPLATPAT